MKCLITGINGFAGSYLAEHLLSHTSNLYGTIYPEDSTQNISHILNRIETIPCNLTIPEQIESIIKKTRPDRIFHLAAQGFVPLSWSDPLSTFQVNVLGTIYLLEAVKKYSPNAHMLIIGSGDEYGSVDGNKPITETTPLNPQNPYAVTKVCTDLLSAQLGQSYKLHIIRVRPFPHIGPRQSPNFVVSNFSRQIALIEKDKQAHIITVGNLESKRDFTDVRDMVKAYWLALEKGMPFEVYNLSSEKAYSIGEILKKLLSLTEAQIKINSDPDRFRIKDTYIKLGNSQKFRIQTGWKPEIPIEQTLKETLNWWREKTLTNAD